MPIKVRNLNSAADGFYNAYPNGRYHIVTEGGVDEVEWYDPHEPENAKNNAKLLLLRYLWPQNGIAHGLPYWSTLNQFLSYTDSWLTDYINDDLSESNAWLIQLLSPWAWEIWSENPGPYEPVLEADIIEGLQVEAAVKDRNGQWHSIFDVIVSQDDLDVTLADYDDLEQTVDGVESQAESCYDAGDTASSDADDAEQEIDAFPNLSAQTGTIESSTSSLSTDAGQLLTQFSALDARITALEQRITQ